jgi:transcriptional regulator with XRE-family HTH domain
MPDERNYSAQRIRELREQRGLTQKQLAELAGVHERSVQNWEKGRGLYGRNLESAAAALQTTVEDLTGRRSRGNELADVMARVERIEAMLTNMRVALNAGGPTDSGVQELVERSLRNLLAARTAPAAPAPTPRARTARR